MRDIKDIMDIKETVDSRIIRESEVRDMMARMRY